MPIKGQHNNEIFKQNVIEKLIAYTLLQDLLIRQPLIRAYFFGPPYLPKDSTSKKTEL